MAQFALALLSLLLAVATPPVSQAPPTGTQNPEAGATQEQGDPNAGPRLFPIAPEKQKIASAHATPDASNHITDNDYCGPEGRGASTADWWVNASTVLLATFTGVLVIVSYCQWRAMRRSLRASQRPWLIPTDDIIINRDTFPIPTDRDIKINLPVFNAGHMPALEVRIYIELSTSNWEDRAPDGKAVHSKAADRKDLNVTMIGPGLTRPFPISTATRAANAPQSLTERDVAAQQERTARIAGALNGGPDQPRLWLYGFIQYRDAFHLRKSYETVFSFYWKPGEAHGRFIMAGPYNRCT